MTLPQRLTLDLGFQLQKLASEAARQSLIAAIVGEQDAGKQGMQKDPLSVHSLVEVELVGGRLRGGRETLCLAGGCSCTRQGKL